MLEGSRFSRGNLKYGLSHTQTPLNTTPTLYTCFNLFSPSPTSHFLSQFTNICSPLNFTSDLNIHASFQLSVLFILRLPVLHLAATHSNHWLLTSHPLLPLYPVASPLDSAPSLPSSLAVNSPVSSLLTHYTSQHTFCPFEVVSPSQNSACNASLASFAVLSNKSVAYLFMCLFLSKRNRLLWLSLQEFVQHQKLQALRAALTLWFRIIRTTDFLLISAGSSGIVFWIVKCS